MKRFALFFIRHPFSQVHLKKDVGLFPIYFSNIFEKVELLKIGKEKKDSIEYKNIIIKDLFRWKKMYSNDWESSKIYEVFCIIMSFFYLVRNRDISHIMLFHINRYSVYFSWLVKKIFPKTKVYIKIDGSKYTVDGLLSKEGLSLKRKCFLSKLREVDLISIETKYLFSELSTSVYFHDNLSLVPNGIERKRNILMPKEKIMLSVARLGTYQKNTEFLLRCFEQMDLQDWKVYLIGSIDESFKATVENFYERRFDLRQSVIFMGEIQDSVLLEEYYSKSSVFLLPSRFESFGIAALEAVACGNYLIMSDVGSAQDLILNDGYGHILKESKEGSQNEEIMMQDCVSVLKNIVDGKVNIYENLEERIAYFNEHFTMENIIKQQCFQEWIG